MHVSPYIIHLNSWHIPKSTKFLFINIRMVWFESKSSRVSAFRMLNCFLFSWFLLLVFEWNYYYWRKWRHLIRYVGVSSYAITIFVKIVSSTITTHFECDNNVLCMLHSKHDPTIKIFKLIHFPTVASIIKILCGKYMHVSINSSLKINSNDVCLHKNIHNKVLLILRHKHIQKYMLM